MRRILVEQTTMGGILHHGNIGYKINSRLNSNNGILDPYPHNDGALCTTIMIHRVLDNDRDPNYRYKHSRKDMYSIWCYR